MEISEETKKQLLGYQENEITEYHIYRKLAAVQKNPGNRRILEEIADDEKKHYEQWKAVTGREVAPRKLSVLKFYWICRILGITFGLKLMERGEADAQEIYREVPEGLADVKSIIEDENDHENLLVNMLDEERLRYVGSVVLGLNDALVELTGALAGLTLALQNTRLIALTGSITGIAAALSMAASEYLSTRTGESGENPVKAAIYTGIAYIFTVVFLILPYLLFEGYYIALCCTMVVVVLIIACFNYYVSVAKDLPFKRRFAEMAALSLGVAGLSFLVGFALRKCWEIEV